MRWSKLFIPTLREEPAEGNPHLRMLVRAGYLKFGVRGLDYLFLGRRTLAKIAGAIRQELDRIDGQEVALTSGIDAMRGAVRGRQVWYQQRGMVFEVFGAGAAAEELRDALARALDSCRIRAIVDDPGGASIPEEFHTPGVKTIADISAFTGMPETSQIKSVVMACGSELVLILLRGDHSLREVKLRAIMNGDVRAATSNEIRERFGADPGSLGPVGLRGVRLLADEALRGRRNMISGANKTDYHLRYVTPGRDFAPEYRDLRAAVDGVGHEGIPIVVEGKLIGSVAEIEPTLVVGSLDLERVLRVGVSRDDAGLVIPPSIAPFSVVFTPVNIRDEAQYSAAEQLYEQARAAGCDALLDDRDERPGVKFKDSELIGIPWRVTVGRKLADGLVEVFERHDKSSRDVPLPKAVELVRERWLAIA
jgi:prolyl-tRNA synthetase